MREKFSPDGGIKFFRTERERARERKRKRELWDGREENILKSIPYWNHLVKRQFSFTKLNFSTAWERVCAFACVWMCVSVCVCVRALWPSWFFTISGRAKALRCLDGRKRNLALGHYFRCWPQTQSPLQSKPIWSAELKQVGQWWWWWWGQSNWSRQLSSHPHPRPHHNRSHEIEAHCGAQCGFRWLLIGFRFR